MGLSSIFRSVSDGTIIETGGWPFVTGRIKKLKATKAEVQSVPYIKSHKIRSVAHKYGLSAVLDQIFIHWFEAGLPRLRFHTNGPNSQEKADGVHEVGRFSSMRLEYATAKDAATQFLDRMVLHVHSGNGTSHLAPDYERDLYLEEDVITYHSMVSWPADYCWCATLDSE
jgi:hypothetical protein